MPIRHVPSDVEAEASGFRGPECQRRREVLRETLRAFERCSPPDRFHTLAHANLARWKAAAERSLTQQPLASVVAGDWGAVTAALTRETGECFAVLNMANAHWPGGAYGEGAVAQEENMFRRTDCHFAVHAAHLDEDGRSYTEAMTKLLSARDGLVYLDTETPRVCIRGPEDRARADLGYPWLDDDAVFPFFELRAAAQDLRDGSPFDPAEARRRIGAQLDTLTDRGVRYAVLSAFGCGAFRNPAPAVAAIYREEIAFRAARFRRIVFAIFHPGYGPDNCTPFRRAFAGVT